MWVTRARRVETLRAGAKGREGRHGGQLMKEINSELPPSGYEILSGDPLPHCDRSNGPRYYPRAPRCFSKQRKLGLCERLVCWDARARLD